MTQKFLLALALIGALFSAACATAGANNATTAAPVATATAPANEAFKEQLRQALKDNPDIVLDVLKANNLKLFDIVLMGQESKRDEAAKDQRTAELKNPFKPNIDPKRPMRGPANAPVTIVAYSDFECPYCAKGSKTVAELMKRHPGQIRFLFKHFPLQSHRMALPAAAYFEAIAMQDQAKAWKFYDMVYSHQDDLERGPAALQEMAAKVGADMDKINKAMEGDTIIKRIREDFEEAKKFEIDAIPAYLINGVSIHGSSSIEEFEKVYCQVQNGTDCK